MCDIERLLEYYQLISPALADEMLARIETAPLLLLEFPRLGERVGRKHSRKWRVTGTPFFLIFEPRRDFVHIKRVHQARENWRQS